MSEKVTIETEEKPLPPTVAESQLQMAVTFGQMTEANRQLMEKISETNMKASQTEMILSEALSEIRAIRSNQDTTGRQVETLKESQMDIISTMVDSEKDENKETLKVTPIKEAKKELEKPAKKRSFLQKIIFGNGQ